MKPSNQPVATSPTLTAVQGIMAEVTGYEPTDIQPHHNFEEDLQLDMETDFPSIVKRVNRHFDTHFSVGELINDVETVDDLVQRIEDETELG